MTTRVNLKELKLFIGTGTTSDSRGATAFGGGYRTARMDLKEGISSLYSADVVIVTQQFAMPEALRNLYGVPAHVEYSICNAENTSQEQKGFLHGLISSISYKGKTYAMMQDSSAPVYLHKYVLTIKSPLESLRSQITPSNYGNKKVCDVIVDIFKSASEKSQLSYEVILTDEVKSKWENYEKEKESFSLEIQKNDESDYAFAKRLLQLFGLNFVFIHQQSTYGGLTVCVSSSSNLYYKGLTDSKVSGTVLTCIESPFNNDADNPGQVRLTAQNLEGNYFTSVYGITSEFGNAEDEQYYSKWAERILRISNFSRNDGSEKKHISEDIEKAVKNRVTLEKETYYLKSCDFAVSSGYQIKIKDLSELHLILYRSETSIDAGILSDEGGKKEKPVCETRAVAVEAQGFSKAPASFSPILASEFSELYSVPSTPAPAPAPVPGPAKEEQPDYSAVIRQYQTEIDALRKAVNELTNSLADAKNVGRINFSEAVVCDSAGDIKKYAGGIFLHESEIDSPRPSCFYAIKVDSNGKPQGNALKVELVSPTQDTDGSFFNSFPSVGQSILVASQDNRLFFIGYKAAQRAADPNVKSMSLARTRRDVQTTSKYLVFDPAGKRPVYTSTNDNVEKIGSVVLDAEISVTDYTKLESLLFNRYYEGVAINAKRDAKSKSPNPGMDAIYSFIEDLTILNNNTEPMQIFEKYRADLVKYQTSDAVAAQALADFTSQKGNVKKADVDSAVSQKQKDSKVFTNIAKELISGQYYNGSDDKYNDNAKVLKIANGGTIEVKADGAVVISAKNVELNASDVLSLWSNGDLSIGAAKGVELVAGNSSVTVKNSGVTLRSNLLASQALAGTLGSTISVDSFRGIDMKGFAVSASGTDGVSLGDAFGGKIGIKGGTSSVSGAQVSIGSVAYSDLFKNCSNYLVKFPIELGTAIADMAGGDKATINTTKTILTKGVSLLSTGYSFMNNSMGGEEKTEGATRGKTGTRGGLKGIEGALKQIRTGQINASYSKSSGWVKVMGVLNLVYETIDKLYTIFCDINDIVNAIAKAGKKKSEQKPVFLDNKLGDKSYVDWVKIVLITIKLTSYEILAGALVSANAPNAYYKASIDLGLGSLSLETQRYVRAAQTGVDAKSPAAGLLIADPGAAAGEKVSY
ncbi:MAG: hypothetical protein J6M93_02425 [Succinivibrio sp.]|nr:hypothetical protein [Succinivibrio sp.]